MPDLLALVQGVDAADGDDQEQAALADLEAALSPSVGAEALEADSLAEPLLHAIEAENSKLVGLLLRARADPTACGPSGVSPLHSAAFQGAKEPLDLLIDAGARADACDKHGQTPLFFAGRADVCSLLEASRADINHLNRKGQSALHLAAHGGLDEVVGWLAERMSPGLLNVQDTRGRTALFCAESAGQRSTVKILEAYGASKKLQPHKTWKTKGFNDSRWFPGQKGSQDADMADSREPDTVEENEETRCLISPKSAHEPELLRLSAQEDTFTVPSDSPDATHSPFGYETVSTTCPTLGASGGLAAARTGDKPATPQVQRLLDLEREASTLSQDRGLPATPSAVVGTPTKNASCSQEVSPWTGDDLTKQCTVPAPSPAVAAVPGLSTAQEVLRLLDLEREASSLSQDQAPSAPPSASVLLCGDDTKERTMSPSPATVHEEVSAAPVEAKDLIEVVDGLVIWEVVLEKTEDTRHFGFAFRSGRVTYEKMLGGDLQQGPAAPTAPETLVITRIGEGYLLDAWNRRTSDPRREVTPGCHILEVNGARGIRGMQRQLGGKSARLRLARYPHLFELQLTHPIRSGHLQDVGLKCSRAGTLLEVLPGGLLEASNASMAARGLFHFVAAPGMRVEAVNGLAPKGPQVDEQCRAAEGDVLRIVLRRTDVAAPLVPGAEGDAMLLPACAPTEALASMLPGSVGDTPVALAAGAAVNCDPIGVVDVVK